MARHRHNPGSIYSPKYWPTWVLVGFAWLIARLPMSWIQGLGAAAGRLLYRFGRSRRRITERNIELCFPKLDPDAHTRLVREVFHNLGIGGLESLTAWLNPRRDFAAHTTITGSEHLERAIAEQRGVVLLGAHFLVMDVMCAPIAASGPIDVMYRYNKNPVWEWLQVKGRAQYFDGVIEREDTRRVLKSLKQGRAVWYAPDQDYGAKHSVFAPFFGIDAATITATSRFARLNGSPVLFLRLSRERDRAQWHMHFTPVLEDFPTGDDVDDATRINALLEEQIRLDPAQYLWLHKRFKTRPPGEASLYDD